MELLQTTNQLFDFTSINTIIQLLALMLVVVCFYIFNTIKSNNETTVELYKLAKSEEVAQLIEKSKSVVHIPDKLNKTQQYELVKQQVIQKHQQYILKISVTLIFIVLFFATILFLIINPIEPISEVSKPLDKIGFTKSPGKIIGIYPSDVFGPDQKNGLHYALETSNLGIEIIDLNFLPFKEMKEGNINVLLDSLRYYIKNENIVSVVGPSISECTDDVLQVLYENKSNVPVFITSAASNGFLNWDLYSKQLHMFRIGSWIDNRASLIAKDFKNISISKKWLFIVENNSPQPTFGKMYYDELLTKSEVLRDAVNANIIDVLYYKPGGGDEITPVLKNNIKTYDYIFVLGVGNEFKMILDQFYTTSNKDLQLPKIGGWMNGYALNSQVKKKDVKYVDRKIFEITDMNLSRAIQHDTQDDYYLKKFESQVGSKVHPGLRDIAITYDAGVCIVEVYKDIMNRTENNSSNKYIKFDSNAYDAFAMLLHEDSFEAVSSRIDFNNEGMNQNVSLNCAIFSASTNTWEHIYLTELLGL